jgi:hypothetical protein
VTQFIKQAARTAQESQLESRIQPSKASERSSTASDPKVSLPAQGSMEGSSRMLGEAPGTSGEKWGERTEEGESSSESQEEEGCAMGNGRHGSQEEEGRARREVASWCRAGRGGTLERCGSGSEDNVDESEMLNVNPTVERGATD